MGDKIRKIHSNGKQEVTLTSIDLDPVMTLAYLVRQQI